MYVMMNLGCYAPSKQRMSSCGALHPEELWFVAQAAGPGRDGAAWAVGAVAVGVRDRRSQELWQSLVLQQRARARGSGSAGSARLWSACLNKRNAF